SGRSGPLYCDGQWHLVSLHCGPAQSVPHSSDISSIGKPYHAVLHASGTPAEQESGESLTIQFASMFVNGLTIAMTLFLNAAGLTLLFGILRILNFAQGTFIMLGAYVAAMFLAHASFGPCYFLLIGVLGGIAIGITGLVIDLIVFRRLRHVD